jgi:hypothetical protein
MSILEILIILLVAVLVLKPEDIPLIIRFINNIRSYFLGIQIDIMKQFEEPSDAEEMNRYLGKIIELDGKYDGKYDIHTIKSYYHKLLKLHSRTDKGSTDV